MSAAYTFIYGSRRDINIPMSYQAPAGILGMIALARIHTKTTIPPNPTLRKEWNYIMGDVYLSGEWVCIEIAKNTPIRAKKKLTAYFDKILLFSDKTYRWGFFAGYLALGPQTRRRTKFWSKSGSKTKYTRITAV